MQLQRLDVEREVLSPSTAVRELDNGKDTRSLSWLMLLWSHRQFLWKAAALGLVLGLVVAFLIPNRYESNVQLMPPDSQSSSGIALLASMAGSAGLGALNSMPSSAAGLASGLLGMKSSGAMFTGILNSRTMQDDLINRFDLRKVYSCKTYQDARKKLSNRTSIDEDRKTGIIKIIVADTDKVRSRDIAAAYVNELDKLVAQLSTSSARRERVFLEERLSEVKKDLDAAAEELSHFSSQNATLDVESEGKAMIESAAQLQGQLIAAESELRGLEAIYTDNNIRIRSKKAHIAELQHQLQKLTGTNGEPSSLAPDQLYPSIRQLPILGVRYLDLYRRLKIEEAVYEALTKQYEIAKVQEAKEIPTVKVLDAPTIAEKKSFPPRLWIALSSGSFCFFAMCGWVVFKREWSEIDDSQPWKMFAIEVLDTLKSATRRLRSRGRRFHITDSVSR